MYGMANPYQGMLSPMMGMGGVQPVQTMMPRIQMPARAAPPMAMPRPAMQQQQQPNPLQQGTNMVQQGNGLRNLYNTVNGWINPQMGAAEAASKSPVGQMYSSGSPWGIGSGSTPAASSQGGATGLLGQGAQTASAIAPTATGLQGVPGLLGIGSGAPLTAEGLYSAGLLGTAGEGSQIGAGLAGAGDLAAGGTAAATTAATAAEAVPAAAVSIEELIAAALAMAAL